MSLSTWLLAMSWMCMVPKHKLSEVMTLRDSHLPPKELAPVPQNHPPPCTCAWRYSTEAPSRAATSFMFTAVSKRKRYRGCVESRK